MSLINIHNRARNNISIEQRTKVTLGMQMYANYKVISICGLVTNAHELRRISDGLCSFPLHIEINYFIAIVFIFYK